MKKVTPEHADKKYGLITYDQTWVHEKNDTVLIVAQNCPDGEAGKQEWHVEVLEEGKPKVHIVVPNEEAALVAMAVFISATFIL